MTTIFVAGTVWFYTLLLISIALVIWALEYDFHWRAAFVILGTFLTLNFFGASTELRMLGSAIWHNPGTSILVFLAYLVAGTIWAILSWKRFLIKKRNEYRTSNYKFREKDVEDIVHYNKHKIISWMAYWPFSILWSALRDPFHEIYERLSGTFRKMVISNLKEFMEKE